MLKPNFLSVLIVSLCLPFLANAEPSTRERIAELTREIRSEARDADVSESILEQVLEQLQETKGLLTGEGNGSSEVCLNFATEAYSINYGNGAYTAGLAVTACKSIQDLSVVKFLYESHQANYGKGQYSFDQAIGLAKGLNGKKALIEFIYTAYASNYGQGAYSAQMAAQKAALVKRRALSCVKQQYEAYKVNYGAGAYSIAAAVDGCARLADEE